MNRTRTALVATGLAAAMTVPLAGSTAEAANLSPDSLAIGLVTGTKLVSFPLNDPGRAKLLGTIDGLSGDTRVVGIDYRVQDRRLYAVGNQGGIYQMTRNQATKVGQLTETLTGTSFDIDFNPAADRLRVVSNEGQNLRHNLNAGGGPTLVDGGLTYPPATTPATGISGAAYTNNDLDDSTATTLFDLDVSLDQVATQAPANAGTLAATGKLGIDVGPHSGFDITGSANTAYATAKVVGSTYRFYSISLLSGDVKDKGRFPGALQVSDIALPIPR